MASPLLPTLQFCGNDNNVLPKPEQAPHVTSLNKIQKRDIPKVSNLYASNQGIVYLIPDNESAIQALSRLKPDKTWHSRYITRISYPLDTKLRSSASVWAYKITTSAMEDYHQGWSLGSGFPRDTKHLSRGVEFRLCASSDKRANRNISNIHARIYIHPTSGAWMFENLAHISVTYIHGSGAEDMLLYHGRSSVLWMRQNRFEIGPYRYVLQFSIPSSNLLCDLAKELDSNYIKARDMHFPAISASPAGILHPLPRFAHRRFEHYISHEHTLAANNDKSVRITAGVKVATGDAVAIKQYLVHGCFYTDSYPLPSSIDTNSSLASGLLPNLSIWCEHSNGFCPLPAQEIVYIAMPLALGDFGKFDFSTVSWATRLRLYRQTLQGLTTLHENGIMHFDIKPGHLLVLSSHPDFPSAAICDFKTAKSDTKTFPLTEIPVHYMPPERWSSDGFTSADEGIPPWSEATYVKTSDVWSLAYSWLWTMSPPQSRIPGWQKQKQFLSKHKFDPPMRYSKPFYECEGFVNRERHESICAFVDEAVDNTLMASGSDAGAGDGFKLLLKSMLMWDHKERITAAKALESPAWTSSVAVTEDAVAEEVAVAKTTVTGLTQLPDTEAQVAPPAPKSKAKRPRAREGEARQAKRPRKGNKGMAASGTEDSGDVVSGHTIQVAGEALAG